MNTKDATTILFEEVQSKIGIVETGAWHTISHNDVELFGKVTYNEQFIHTDKSLAEAESPYGALIAHAYLTLALIPLLTSSLSMTPVITLNYGFNKIRFPEATRIGAKVRANRTVHSIKKHHLGVLVTQMITIEQEHIARPSVVAESLVLLIPRMGKNG